MKHPYRPEGCDDQGRHPEAAEAATEVGLDEPERDTMRVVLVDLAIATAIVGAIAVVVLLAIGRG
jgi:hypothetical protein